MRTSPRIHDARRMSRLWDTDRFVWRRTLSDRMRRCRRCDESLCERCVKNAGLCYMVDGAYPGATSSEQGAPKGRERGQPTQVLARGADHGSFYFHAYETEWCKRFRLHFGMYGRVPLMQLFT